ncbi:MAG: general secretion pathway protein GspB [Desulfohalobiaceae bacterium]|nr:general secretion pathway protein GspB [Desulfohalobiaceae bacterium]
MEKKLNSSPSRPVKNEKSISASGSEDPWPDNVKRVAGLEPSSPRPQPETSPAQADREHKDHRPAKPKESISRTSTPSAAPFEALSQQKKSGFTLQALVWSQEAAECWAMVNGRSVRVGDFVNQAKVAHIGQGHIVFEKNGKRWKHPFQ